MRFMSSGASPRWKHVQSCSLSAALGSGTELSDRFSEVEGWGGVGRVSGTQKFAREDFFFANSALFSRGSAGALCNYLLLCCCAEMLIRLSL